MSGRVLNGILWILRTGALWADLPKRYPSKSTCHCRFQEWTASGVFARILTALAEDLEERGGIDLAEGFIDGPFAPAKKGAMPWARPNGACCPNGKIYFNILGRKCAPRRVACVKNSAGE